VIGIGVTLVISGGGSTTSH